MNGSAGGSTNEPTGETEAPAPIRPLSGVLVNQIAAGEVVERPASVVKELVENALDARAGKVAVELETGGARLIRVRDDGFGIPSGELTLALSRHATSKIAALEDLDRIASMGFRGEALPSIASVSRLTLESRPREAAGGARVRVEGGARGAVEPAALKPGTTVEVRDLFYNVPARRKFLRTPRTELRHVEDAVRRLALARPDVSFALHHDARKVFETTRRMERARRLSRLLGQEFAERALEISFEAGGLSVRGFLAPPEAARTRPDLQFLFVNGRGVRDDVVRHAVRVGFGDSLAGAGYPAFVLYLGVEPGMVDVNVHPTKHEVRFREPRHVHDFVRHAVARALGGFTSEASLETTALALDAGTPSPGITAPGPEAAAPGTGAAVPTSYPTGRPGGARPGAGQVRDHLAAYAALSSPPRGAGSGAAPGRVRLGGYVLVEGRGELLLIELAAGRRALVRDRLDEAMRKDAPVSRPLLIPHTRTVPGAVADAVDEACASLRSLGVEVRRGAPGSITLRAIPPCLAGVEAEKLLESVAGWAESRGPVAALADALSGLAGSSPAGDHVGDVIEAALGGRLSAGAIAVDEAVLRRIFSTAAARR